MTGKALPSEAEVLEYHNTCSNWGRWGPEDQLGTLNLVNDEKGRQAGRLVVDGVSVSCAWPITTEMPGERTSRVLHYMTVTGEAGEEASWSGDFLGMAYHGNCITHVDALCHVFAKGQMYNGFSSKLVTSQQGAQAESVELLAQGVVTRGVLLDIARLRGVRWMEAPVAIFPEDLEAAEEAQGLRVETGDILLIRTGHLARYYKAGPLDTSGPRPGPHAACIPWFRERDIAMLAGDQNNEVSPCGYERLGEPIHETAIPAMGLWLIDNANLEELAEACAERKRWEFMMVIAPLRFHNATGSPINPIAVF